MDSELVAVALTYAPSEQNAIWKHEAMNNVLERWEADRPDAFERVFYCHDTGYLIEIKPRCTDLGQYGWDTDYVLEVGVDESLLESIETTAEYRQALRDYADALEDELCAVVSETQERSQFSPKEFVAFLLYQRGEIGERQAADALGIAVGTYRGKLGRIRNKIDAAWLTMDLMDKSEAEQTAGPRERTYQATGDLVDIYEADEYPAEGILREDIVQVAQNIINVREHQDGVAHYDTVIGELQERFGDEEISYHRARYELERAIGKGTLERDGNVVTIAE